MKKLGWLKIIFMFLFLFIVLACGGGDGGFFDPISGLIYPTGNQDFTLADGQNADMLNGYRTDDPESNVLPDSIDHSSSMPTVRNQGQSSSCTSWAVGYYGKSYQEAVEEEWDINQNAFSPMYLYAMQCRNYDQPWHMIKAWEILNRYGCAKWSSLEFQDYGDPNSPNAEKQSYANVSISETVQEEARTYRSGEMTQLYNLNQVKSALTKGPVVLGINYYDTPPELPSPEENYMRHNPSNTNVGHAILCVGYDDNKFGSGALKFVNSWGSQWAIDGYSWIRYADVGNIIIFAMDYKDITNPNQSDIVTTRPDAPTDVNASDGTGPYVDIDWAIVSNAQYYRIYRAEVEDLDTYQPIGITYETTYRDYPEPGQPYYYSIVSVNDLGESDHFASDTDAKQYVDQGSAVGSTLNKPEVAWEDNNPDGSSNFSVSTIDPSATAMEVFVAKAAEGPWASLGWIEPNNFTITWGADSKYVGSNPYVRVRVTSADGYSELSDNAQVGEQLVSDVEVAEITTLTASPSGDAIQLNWDIDGGSVDFFEIWRYRAVADEQNDWILLDYAQGSETSYIDASVLPGVSYYYAIFPNYQGTYGPYAITDDPVTVQSNQENLYLYEFSYNYGQISNPAHFEITVWNTGDSAIDDYTIGIMAYSYIDGITHLVQTVNASAFAYSRQLPLQAGYQHTIQIPINVPSGFADGNIYSWGIKVDYNDAINELYEDDNYLWGYNYWWMAGSYSQLNGKDSIAVETYPMDRSDRGTVSSRPFAKKNSASQEAMLMEPLNKYKPYTGPIRFHKPSFNNDHSK